ncbi:MAG: bifunctional protein FolD [Dictyoglomus sp. NZ13-RE01]|nr:MAG: bifunctional protein FolD [Dictyoglomus sp. NZ13-RE01]
MAEILKGKPVAEFLESEIMKEVSNLKEKNIYPKLGIIGINVNEESRAYSDNIEKVFGKLGIKVEKKFYDESISLEELKEIFINLKNDDSIHGILLLRPLPEYFEKQKVYKFLPSRKDIEGLTYENCGRLFYGEKSFVPCTPLAVLELLDFYNIPIEGKHVVIVGRSISVGRPLSLLFLNRNATVTICHSKTKDLALLTRQADILVSAVGKANFIDENMVNENAIVIDVGTNIIDGKIVGDVNFENVKKKVKAITPVPGGIGIITIRTLAKNLLRAVKNEVEI